jgi:hypothetical protein
MRRDLRVVLDSFTEYQIGFGNEFHIKASRFNIKTSPFRIRVRNQIKDVYFTDLVDNTDSTKGSIFIFSLPSPTSKDFNVERENVGSIDYMNGIITLNPINIISAKPKDGQNIIEIAAIPHSNDVIGKQDLYLRLDISKSNFEMIQDSISSGLDFSASNYTVSSSYTNNNLVRL